MERVILALLPKTRYPLPLRYAASLAIVGIALLLRLSLDGALRDYPLLMFFPAIFLAALVFDRGSGFFATFASTALAAWLLLPRGTAWLPAIDQVAPLALFALIGCGIAWLTEMLRGTAEKLQREKVAHVLLLEEMAHRVKNDLTVVGAVLSLQAKRTGDAEARAALEGAVARIGVVAQAHAQLQHRRDHRGRLDLAGYLRTLCEGLGDLLREVRPIAVRVEADALEVSPSDAVAIGLLVNELVTNAFKHAYPDDRGGTVTVTLRATGEGIDVTVADDGVGCPPQAEGGLGSRLVQLLASQLGGRVEREPVPAGCRVTARLPVRTYRRAQPRD